MNTKNNETNVNKKEIPFLGEIKSKEVNLISNMKESKHIVLTVEEYTDIVETKSYAMGKVSILEKQIEKIKDEKCISDTKRLLKREMKSIIEKLENEIKKLNPIGFSENVKENAEYTKAKQEGKIEGINLAIETIKETE